MVVDDLPTAAYLIKCNLVITTYTLCRKYLQGGSYFPQSARTVH